MNVMLDLNVLMDVFEKRQPHYGASARLISLVLEGALTACIPGHAPATIHYLGVKSIGRESTDAALDWLLASFEVAPANCDIYLRARAMGFPDYEDAITTAMAEVNQCDFIVTRNTSDFAKSSVAALTPEEMLVRLGIAVDG